MFGVDTKIRAAGCFAPASHDMFQVASANYAQLLEIKQEQK